MKKTASIILMTLMLTLLLAACGWKAAEKPAADGQNVPYSRGPSVPPSIGEPTSPAPK